MLVMININRGFTMKNYELYKTKSYARTMKEVAPFMITVVVLYLAWFFARNIVEAAFDLSGPVSRWLP